jgi:hypothetical protein
MRFLAGVREEDKRNAAETAMIKDKSPDTVKIQVRGKEKVEPPEERLEKEKTRLERTIAALTKRLEEVRKELAQQ